LPTGGGIRSADLRDARYPIYGGCAAAFLHTCWAVRHRKALRSPPL